MERRLAAILAADVVGYSRLIETDETATLTALRSLFRELVEPTLKQHRGRVVKLMGDGLLAEFASVVDAVSAAIEIQNEVPARSSNLPADRQVLLRIGVNIGDVVVEGSDIFGDGVNVAARLQEVSNPNGIALSYDAFRQLSGKLDASFEDAGEIALKNIRVPVRTMLWTSPSDNSATTEVKPEPSVFERPSIAVLPFDFLSATPDHEFLADGVGEDIITGLSGFKSLSVIARNSSFAYKGKSPDIRTVAEELGVRYVLEGSLRSANNRLRVNVQLIDANDGSHIWGERFDRGLDDLFTVQDEITSKIVATIAPEIEQAERRRGRNRAPDSVDTWLLYQKGLAGAYESSQAGLLSAIEILDQVAAADPAFAHAHAMAADARSRYCVHFVKPDEHQKMAELALASARKATALDGTDPLALHALARAFAMSGRHNEAVAAAEEAVALNPYYARYHQTLGYVSHIAGANQQAVESLKYALQLSPRDGYAGGFLVVLASTLLCLGRDEEALETARRGCQAANPRWWCFGIAAAAAQFLGRESEAQQALRELYDQHPRFRVDELAAMGKNWQTTSWDRLVAGLVATGAKH